MNELNCKLLLSVEEVDGGTSKRFEPLINKKRIRKLGLQLCKYVGLKYLESVNTQALQGCWKTGNSRHALLAGAGQTHDQ